MDQSAQPGQGQQVLKRHRAPVKDRGEQKRRVGGKKCRRQGCRRNARDASREVEEGENGDNTQCQDRDSH
jgi:hypothetical protein